MSKELAFIGAGKMATAIAAGLINKDVLSAEAIIAADPFEASRTAVEDKTSVTTTEQNKAAIAESARILLAVKPQEAENVLTPLKNDLQGKLLISIAAGLKIAKLQNWSGTEKIIRVMPNTPAMVNKGASVIACYPSVKDDDKAFAKKIFSAIGIVYEMDEDKLDAVTALSGSGPAFLFHYIEAMTEAAVALGLEQEAAQALLVQTIAGSAEMLQQGLGSPEELRIAVTSKGGTTAAGLESLASDDFKHIISNCLTAATRRSIELGED